MGRLVRGQVIIGQFPFSGTEEFKRRPLLVLHSWPFGRGTDVLVCMITSQKTSDPFAIEINADSFVWGGLPISSCFARPLYLAALAESACGAAVGELQSSVVAEIVTTIINNLA